MVNSLGTLIKRDSNNSLSLTFFSSGHSDQSPFADSLAENDPRQTVI